MHEPVTSLWTTRSTRRPRPPLDGDRRVDVVVVGGGVAGLSAATRLREDGADVLVLERHRVAHGVTGGSTAKVTALHGLAYSRVARAHGREAAAVYARANADAVVEMCATVERFGIDCDLTRAAASTYATTARGRAAVAAEAEAASVAGLPVRLTDSTDLPFEVTAAVVLDDQAHLDPVRYCEGLADRLGAAALAESTPVLAIEEDDRGCRAVTPAGVVHADEAVIATLAPIVDPRYLTARCRPVRTYALAAEVDGSVPAGMYLSADDPHRSVRPAAVDGTRWLIVGGAGHPVGDEGDARSCLDELESWARRHFGVSSVVARWAAHDLIPADHLPFIGRVTGGSRHWVVTGMQKWGLSTSVVAAGIISAGIAGGEHDAARLLDSTRLRSSATPDLGRDVARVAARYVADQVRPRLPGQAVAPGAVAPGDGAVVHTRHGLTAVYRDDEGHLHATSARCTHEGCVVRFNRAQASWDCPCHGSRFATDGTVLAGPAVDGLRPVDLSD